MPQLIGRYRVGELIASGGMADVFASVLESEHGFRRNVVIKRMKASLAEDPELKKSFSDEAKLCARLQHANIVQVLDYGLDGDTPYLVMEKIDGLDLEELLSRVEARKLDAKMALCILTQLSVGLHYAHTLRTEEGRPLGIVHRDVNPRNVLISGLGEVKLTDFGIARALDRSASKTQPGIVKGKLHYLAPEQALGGGIDSRADVYALGLLGFELLTGERYLQGDNVSDLLTSASHPNWRAPSSIDESVNEAVEAILKKALSVDREDRFRSAEHFGDAIEALALIDKSTQKALGLLVTSLNDRPRSEQAARNPEKKRAPAAETVQAEPQKQTLVLPGSGTNDADPTKNSPRARRRIIEVGALLGFALILSMLVWTRIYVRPTQVVLVSNPLPNSEALRPERVDARDEMADTVPQREPPEAAKEGIEELVPKENVRVPSKRMAPSIAASTPAISPPSPAPQIVETPEAQVSDAPPVSVLVGPSREEATAAIASAIGVRERRGILETDSMNAARAVAAANEALGRHDHVAAVGHAEQAQRTYSELKIDRAFIERKLERIEKTLKPATNSQGERQHFKRRANEIASLLLERRYEDANRALNELVR